MNKNALLSRLKNKEAVIGIVGLGYVGLPLALRYAEIGYKVVGFDIDETKIGFINRGESYIKHINAEDIKNATREKFSVTSDFSQATKVDALILCIPTPLNKWREPDLSYIVNTTDTLLPYLRAGQVVSLESTTYPGNTEEVLKPKIESRNLEIGKDIFLIYSPEREDPGNPKYKTADIPKVCGGTTANCLEIGIALYEQVVVKVIPVSSTKAAEMTKLLENIHRAVNIGLVNEMKIVADKMGIDIYEVINAASTKPFGFVPYYPGPGLGGHCIPIDPFYLTWKAREYDLHTRFIELAGEINSDMPNYVIQKTLLGLNEQQKAIKNSKIMVLGAAYKKNVDDMRESPSLVIMERLIALGANVCYHDPYVPQLHEMRHHHLDLASTPFTEQTIREQDCVLISTAHDDVDYKLLLKCASLIIDTRGVFSGKLENVVKA